jgi:hypothetical protein
VCISFSVSLTKLQRYSALMLWYPRNIATHPTSRVHFEFPARVRHLCWSSQQLSQLNFGGLTDAFQVGNFFRHETVAIVVESSIAQIISRVHPRFFHPILLTCSPAFSFAYGLSAPFIKLLTSSVEVLLLSPNFLCLHSGRTVGKISLLRIY